MKVLAVCYKYPPSYSGYGKQLNTIIQNITNTHKDIYFNVACGKFDGINHFYQNKVNMHPVGSKRLTNIHSALGFYFYAIKLFFWIISNKNRIDVIHCVKAGPEALAVILAAKLINKPVIVKIVQSEMNENELKSSTVIKKILRKVRYPIITSADKYIAISKDIKKRLLNHNISADSILSIPNAVDESKFNMVNEAEKISLRKDYGVSQLETVILFSGSVSRRKGIFDLIDSYKELKLSDKTLLLICGPMYENETKILTQIEDINREKTNLKIRYEGNVNNIEKYLQLSDILVLPSYSEGLPNVLLEGAMSGVALLASDIGGNNEVIEDEHNGLLFPVGNCEKMTEKLSELILNKEKRRFLGINANKDATNLYSLSNISKQYYKIYKSMKHSS